MGVRLIVEVMDHAPRSLTAAEWKALVILAEDANDATRMVWRPIEDEQFLTRMGVEAERWKNIRASLKRKGALEQVGEAYKGRVARFRIPKFPPAQPSRMGHGTSAPVDEAEPKGHGNGAPLAQRGTESAPHQPPKGHGIDPQRGTDPVPPTPQYPSRENHSLSHLSQREAATRATGPTRERENNHQSSVKPPPDPAQIVTDAYAKACANAGRPATPSLLRDIHAQVVEILAAGNDAPTLARVAAWMGSNHPGWRDLNWARTAPGSPGVPAKPAATGLPGPRASPNPPPCTTGACRSHDHDPCSRTGQITLDNETVIRCPCWHTVEARF